VRAQPDAANSAAQFAMCSNISTERPVKNSFRREIVHVGGHDGQVGETEHLAVTSIYALRVRI
jgi:hypothetical protein